VNLRTVLLWIARGIWLVVFVGTVVYSCFKPSPHLLAYKTSAPDFALQDVSGKTVKLSDYRGRVVVLDFWSTWCPACQQTMPEFSAAADSFDGQPVTFIGINTWDDWDSFKSWVPHHWRYSSVHFVYDPNPEGADVANLSYKVTCIPTVYVIDKRGAIADSLDWPDQEQVTDAVNGALNAP